MFSYFKLMQVLCIQKTQFNKQLHWKAKFNLFSMLLCLLFCKGNITQNYVSVLSKQ